MMSVTQSASRNGAELGQANHLLPPVYFIVIMNVQLFFLFIHFN